MIDEVDYSRENCDSLQQKKYEILKKKTIWSIVLAVPLMLIGIVFMDIPYANYIMWALSTPIVFVFGQQFFVGAWRQLKNRSSNMVTLVAMSTGIAYIFSFFNTLFPDICIIRDLKPNFYSEAA